MQQAATIDTYTWPGTLLMPKANREMNTKFVYKCVSLFVKARKVKTLLLGKWICSGNSCWYFFCRIFCRYYFHTTEADEMPKLLRANERTRMLSCIICMAYLCEHLLNIFSCAVNKRLNWILHWCWRDWCYAISKYTFAMQTKPH